MFGSQLWGGIRGFNAKGGLAERDYLRASDHGYQFI